VSDPERRCPNCGALVSADADWCGQCFFDLRPPPVPPPPPQSPAEIAGAPAASPAATATAADRSDAFWPCSVCGARNPIALEICETCGTPFAAVMRGTARQKVDPEAARKRSLLFPGAGHAMLGYPLDGFARGALFVLALVLALLLLIAVPHSGPALLAIVLTVGLAVGVYILSAVEIDDLAARGHLIVPSKFLLWGGVAVMFLVVGAIALSVATTARR
jgi:ribosomal protein L40E